MTPPRRRDRQLVRVLRLRRELQEHAGTLTLEQLGRRFNINPRTIRRDLYALADAGEPIEHPVLDRRRPEEP